jgi:hypothetical protein
MPWQEIAAQYLTATDANGLPMFREVCVVVSRQNGKTELAKPFIVRGLRSGRRVMHLAQTRELPRLMFRLIAGSLEEALFLKQRGKGGKMHTVWPRFGSGSEEILLANDGSYRIAAANRGGSRGFTNDIVVVDELREMESQDIIAAVESTTVTSPYAQFLYLSNAGTEESVVLNDIRLRAESDPSLAYLEWSAAPDRMADDIEGWLEANPAIGHIPSLLDSLTRLHRKHVLGGTLSTFETENLCRWVVTMRERLVDEFAWQQAEVDELVPTSRSYLGIAMDPAGRRASAVLAWQEGDGVAMKSVLEGIGEPIDAALLGPDLRDLAKKYRVRGVAFDPMTDGELAKYVPKAEKVIGTRFVGASSNFVQLITTRRLRWSDSPSVTDDLQWTARKPSDERGAFSAVRANDDRPITAALAAIRAVELASGPKRSTPRVY